MGVEPVRPGYGDAVRDRVDGADRGAADADHHARRPQARVAVGADRRVQRPRVHGEIGIRGDLHKVVLPDAGQPHRLVDRRMGLRAGIDAQRRAAGETLRHAVPTGGPVAHGDDGRQRAGGGGVVDGAGEVTGEAQRLAQPRDHDLFDLGRRRRGLPQHALRRHGIGQLLGPDRGRCGIGGKIGEEAGMLPMGHRVRHDGLEICEDLGRVGGGLRRALRQSGGGVARPDGGSDRPVPQAGMVVADPVGGAPAPRVQIVVVHGARDWRGAGRLASGGTRALRHAHPPAPSRRARGTRTAASHGPRRQDLRI